MNRYLNNFRFNYDEIVLGDLEILEPTVVRSKVTGSYYTLAGEPAKRLFSGIHMRSKNFSNTLYQVDIPTWRNLIEKKLTNADVKNFLFSNKAVVMDSHIVSIVEGSPALPSLIDALNKFATDDIDCHYTFDALNQLVFLAIDKETKVGILATYYTQSNWLTVNNVYLDDADLLCISPYKVYNDVVKDDIAIILDKDMLMQGANLVFDNSTRKEFEEALCSPLSAEELSWYMKHLFKVKMDKDSKPNLLNIANDLELDSRTTEKLAYLMTKLDNESDEVSNTYYSNYLKKSITMTSVTYGILAEVIYCMVDEDRVSIDLLSNMYNDIIRKHCHYNYINQ